MGFFSPYSAAGTSTRALRRTLYLRAFKFWPIRIHFERGQAVIYACGACGSRPRRGEATPGRGKREEEREERSGSSGVAERWRGTKRTGDIEGRSEREMAKRSSWKRIEKWRKREKNVIGWVGQRIQLEEKRMENKLERGLRYTYKGTKPR